MKKLFWFFILIVYFIKGNTQNHNFLLITIDTWRADYISVYPSKNPKVFTPNLDALAKEGLYLKYMETPSPITAPAHASILTGLYPKKHGIRDNRYFKLKEGVTTLPELFKRKKYKTVAVISSTSLLRIYGLDKGFDVYNDENLTSPMSPHLGMDMKLKKADHVSDLGLKYLNENSGPIFMWLHFYDPHEPYNPPDKFKERYKKDYYAGEVAYVDEALGRFLSKIKSDEKNRWTIIIVGDHGEDLYDHGEKNHGILLYNTSRKVPFLLWDSKRKYENFIKEPKSLIDIFPTIIEIFNLENVPSDGVSIFKEVKRKLFFETFMPLGFSVNPGFGLKDQDFVYIKHGTALEIYEDDFYEGKNLIKEKKEFALEAERLLKDFYKNDYVKANLKLSEEESKALASLGYLGSITLNLDKVTKCDLKDFAKDYSYYQTRTNEIINLKEDLNLYLQLADEMIKKYPSAGIFHCDKASIYLTLNKLEEASKACQICATLDKENPFPYRILGDISASKGKFKEAERYYLESLKYNPLNPLIHFNLGFIYLEKLNDKEKAIYHLTKFMELDPKNMNVIKVKSILNRLKK